MNVITMLFAIIAGALVMDDSSATMLLGAVTGFALWLAIEYIKYVPKKILQ